MRSTADITLNWCAKPGVTEYFIERLRQNIEQSIKNSRVDCSNKEPAIVAMRHCQNLALSLRLVQLKDRQVALTEIACQPSPTRYARLPLL